MKPWGFASATGLTLVGVLFSSSPVGAGPLAQTARGIDNKSSSDSDSSSNTSTRDHRDSSSDRDASDTGSLMTGGTTCYDCEAQSPVQIHLGPATWDTRIMAQKVRDSDGSFRMDASVLFGEVGALVSIDHYFENISAKAANGLMEEDVRMNLIEVAPMVRMFNNGVVSLDLRLGLSIAASSHFDTLAGGALGLRLQARANEQTSINLEGRAMAYQHDIVAYEGAAGLQYGIGWLGYRALKFDVGPALEGPEAGLRFTF